MSRLGMCLHVSPTTIAHGSRIARSTGYAAKRNIFSAVEVAGILLAGFAAVEKTADGRTIRRFAVNEGLRKYSRLSRLFSFLSLYAAILRQYWHSDIACVSAHTVSVLPLCWLLAKHTKSKLIYEPHELESETATARGVAKSLIRLIERTFGKRADAVICVNRGIAEWYKRTYRLDHVWTIRNLPAHPAYKPLPEHYFARRFGFAPSCRVFLYQGIFAHGRGIDVMIEAFRKLPEDNQLVFVGFGPLEAMVENAARETANVHAHPAVPSEELLRYTAAADVGMMLIKPISLSYQLCYPNKYCESLTAGIPVICTDSLWLNEEVRRYNCGWSVPYGSDDLAAAVLAMSPDDIMEKRAGAAAWSRENSWPMEEKHLDAVYQTLFPQIVSDALNPIS